MLPGLLRARLLGEADAARSARSSDVIKVRISINLRRVET